MEYRYNIKDFYSKNDIIYTLENFRFQELCRYFRELEEFNVKNDKHNPREIQITF